MRILATLLSIIITVTVVIGVCDKRPPECGLCKEERIIKAMTELKYTAFENNNI